MQGIFLSCQTIRRANPDSLFAAMGHLGLRIELEDSSQRIEPFIDQYLASHQRYLLALRRTHLSNSPVAKLIDHMLLTLETGVPTAQTKMARTFLQLFYPSIPLRGQYRENREPQSSFDRYSPLHQLHLHFEGFDLAEHNRSAVFIEALMTDAQLDDLLSGKKPDSGRAANWLRVKLKLP